MPVSRHILNTRLTPSGSALLGFVVLVEILARDLLFSHVGEFKDEIDHLVLIDRRTKLGERIVIVAIVVPDLLLASGHLARALDDRAADPSSVTVILFFSPISDSTRPSRTRRSAILWYSSLAASSVVFSDSKVLPVDSISALIEFHIRLNSSSTSDGGASKRWLSSRRSSSMRLTRCRVAPANSATSRSRAASFSFSRDSRPSVLANSSSILVSCGASIKVAVVSNSV